MDFALYCLLQILLSHFFQFVIHSKGRNLHKLAILWVQRSNVSSQMLILIYIFILDLCKFILKKNLDFQVTNFISIKEGFFSQSASRFVKFNTNTTLANCQ